ncbi:MAG TPA: BON domain-containing protein [Microvirga sp.]|nr:BON domain-containing protein [Microvirga sp.]
MVDTRQRNRNRSGDDNGYGDVPSGAVGTRGLRGRQYPGGYGDDTDEFTGGVVDAGRGGPPDDAGFAPRYTHHSGYGAFGTTDRDDERGRRQDDEARRAFGPHRGRGPKGYQRSDERIHEDVCERLADDPFIDASDIEVEVRGREVTLSGTVDSRGLRFRAEDLAAAVSGVAHVQNNLRIRSNP